MHASVVLGLLAQVLAVDALQAQVLSSFIFSRHGDRTPLDAPELSILTPFGAQQMYEAGGRFRQRYLTSTFSGSVEDTTIRDISRYMLDNEEVVILSTDQQFTVASAQAFLQALYPPLTDSYNQTVIPGVSSMANGSNVIAPLGGYQYPTVQSVSAYDLNSIWIDGTSHCAAYTGELLEYYKTPAFAFLYNSTLSFYRSLGAEYLAGDLSADVLNYYNAYYIWDYLQYNYRHNATVAKSLSVDNYTKAEILASDWIFALFGDATNQVRTIAGRTLANQIQNAFYQTITTQGSTNKLTLYFGDFAPMSSLAALLNLAVPSQAVFYGIPPMASSFVFELVALTPDGSSSPAYPNTTDMYVRFYFQDGIGLDANWTEYPLFGRSPSEAMMSYSEFVSAISQVSLGGVAEWCQICQSFSVFCPDFTGTPGTNGSSNQHYGHRGDLSPAVAGVIGAVVSLAIAALLVGLLMAFAGFRFRRQANKKSQLGGFKGSQKLASDQDLTLPKGGAAAQVTEITEDSGPRGHERIGSWELKDANKAAEAGMATIPRGLHRRPSVDDDVINVNPYAEPVKPHQHV